MRRWRMTDRGRMTDAVLVTGAFGLVGSATVRHLARAGRHVVATDLDTPATRKAAAMLPAGVQVHWADLTDSVQVTALLDRSPGHQTRRFQAFGNVAGNAEVFQVGIEVFELSGQHLQPLIFQRAAAIILRVAFPTDQHKLLMGKMPLEPAVGLRFRKVAGQPVLDVVAVGHHRPAYAHPKQREQENRHQDDGEGPAGEE